MANPNLPPLSRCERQIMDVLYRLERGTAAEILDALTDQPSYSTIRAQLRVLEEKGHVSHDEQNLRYIYHPTVPREKVRGSALRHLVDTFFDGSTEQVMTALLGGEVSRLTPEEIDRLSLLLEKAKERPASTSKKSRRKEGNPE
jgi:BlaI family penicillinase repressor